MTPLEKPKQYDAIRSENPDALLVFESAGFCHLFDDDATYAGKTLGLPVGISGIGTRFKLASFPARLFDGYVAKLVRSGRRVAVCNPA